MALDSARVLISGASGLLGGALVRTLQARGFGITRLMRGTPSSEDQIHWVPTRSIDPESVSGFDAVIHLAGESVAARWSETRKAKIRESRVTSTRNLTQALARASKRPSLLITASAIGYYGDRADEILNEKSVPGSGFLADVCREWEAANQPATDAGIRTVQLRTGVVLSSKGGALKKMLPPFRMGVGGNLGSGRQWMSWIHIQDWVGAVHHILKNDLLQGPV
ncbi:MAG TPA: TIGR01777 family oxidoreductase, partial [Terriglobales bacterium]|nr:TIGR01777 family oxidoreductase [Terriglobales bacterium]